MNDSGAMGEGFAGGGDIGGLVSITHEVISSDDERLEALAFFSESPMTRSAFLEDLIDEFPELSDGECVRYEGDALDYGQIGASLDLGTEMVVLGELGELVLERDETAFGVPYYEAGSVPELFDGGGGYRLEAAGGDDVQALALELMAPPALRVLSPALDGNPELDRTADLPIAWEPLGEGSVFAQVVRIRDGNEVEFRTVCRFNDDGEAVLPASVLQDPGYDEAPERFNLLNLARVRSVVMEPSGVSGPVPVLFVEQEEAVFHFLP